MVTDTNIVLDAITLTLSEAFPNSEVFGESVDQKLTDESFIVRVVSNITTPLLWTNTEENILFEIVYFPKKGDVECYSVGNEVTRVLRLIELSNSQKLYGKNIGYKVVDGILHVSVSFRYFTREYEEAEMMEKLKIE